MMNHPNMNSGHDDMFLLQSQVDYNSNRPASIAGLVGYGGGGGGNGGNTSTTGGATNTLSHSSSYPSMYPQQQQEQQRPNISNRIYYTDELLDDGNKAQCVKYFIQNACF